MNDLWIRALTVVAAQVPPQVFERWIKPLRPVGPVSEGRLQLLARNSFSLERVRKGYAELLANALSEAHGTPVRVEFRLDDNPEPEAPLPEQRPSAAPAQPQRDEAGDGAITGLDLRYTFDSFVVGGCNQFVHAAAQAVADAPAGRYNPLFIYGGVGLGKTHIMQAIGNQVRAVRPDMRVLYTTSEKFMTRLINAIRYDRMFDFKEQFRSVDVLMVDDIQFIAGKERTQEEFFHLFNALFEAKKQIVVTSDQFPNEIEKLEERLRSRFGWGLVADIQAPELETRIAILEKKAANMGLPLAPDVAFYLANAITTNIRELEGALIRVTAYASLTKRVVTMELVKESLRDLVKQHEKQISIEHIQKTVAAYYKVRPADLRSPNRSRIFSHPRQIAMYLCKQLTRHSYPEIGHQFGGRDHTTVLHAVRRVDGKMREEINFAEEVGSLTSMLQR